MRVRKPAGWYLLNGLVLLLFGLNLYRTTRGQNGTSDDFSLYAKFIDPIKLHGTIATPHFIYPALVAIASFVFPGISYSGLGAGIVLIFQLLLASILWNFWKTTLTARATDWLVLTLVLVCMLIAPVNLLTPHNGYFGYIGITIYHNPPMMISRPIALLHFLLFAGAIASGSVPTRKTVTCFISIIIATLMKPNYALIMIPVTSMFAVWSIFRKDVRMFNFIFFGSLLPAVLILFWQYQFTYASHNTVMGESHIIFKPFFVYLDRSQDIGLKFVLSILFPLGALIVCWKQAVRDRYFLAGLMVFVFGAIQSYLFAESGPRIYDGNFLWSAQIGLFLWFIVSMRLALKHFFLDPRFVRWSPGLVTLSILLLLHVVSGLIWYAHETIAPGAFW
jgi:hypothetical protein